MFSTIHPFIKTGLIPLAIVLSSCASAPGQPPSLPTPAIEVPPAAYQDAKPVIRSSRYTLLSIAPRPDQSELLDQIIDIRIPEAVSPSIEEAMSYVLRHSGYRLCPGNQDVNLLYAHTLPASQYQLGPITLRRALQILAGPAWEMSVDELTRTLCFNVKSEYQRPTPVTTAGSVFAAPANEPLQHGGE